MRSPLNNIQAKVTVISQNHNVSIIFTHNSQQRSFEAEQHFMQYKYFLRSEQVAGCLVIGKNSQESIFAKTLQPTFFLSTYQVLELKIKTVYLEKKETTEQYYRLK